MDNFNYPVVQNGNINESEDRWSKNNSIHRGRRRGRKRGHKSRSCSGTQNGSRCSLSPDKNEDKKKELNDDENLADGEDVMNSDCDAINIENIENEEEDEGKARKRKKRYTLADIFFNEVEVNEEDEEQRENVPFDLMTAVPRMVNEISSINKGTWVRLKRGIFKDDLAQVDYVNFSKNSVLLKLIPRIDYNILRGTLRKERNESEYSIRKRTQRPEQKLFDIDAVKAIGGEVIQDGDFLSFESNLYSRKGFLYKWFAMFDINADEVKPTLSELEKFEEHTFTDLESITSSNEHSFTSGDNVKVVEGELTHLVAKVTRTNGYQVTISPTYEDLEYELEFMAHELRKHFRQGDNVKIIGGRHEGESGVIIRVEENMIVLFSDLTMDELEVLPEQLQLSPDEATDVESVAQFLWGELVLIDAQTVGIIVRVEEGNLQVLTMHGTLIHTKSREIQKKKENSRGSALDCKKNIIKFKDIVLSIDGPHSGLKGEIRYIYRNTAFLYSELMKENGGIFVCKTKHVILSKEGMSSTAPDGTRMTQCLTSSKNINVHHNGKTGVGTGVGSRAFGEKGRCVRKDKEIIGKIIKIIKGPYKGYQQSYVSGYTFSSPLELWSPMTLDASPYNSQTQGSATSVPSKNAIIPVSCGGYEQSSIPGYTSSSHSELWSPMTPDASPNYRQPYGNATSVPSENAITPVHCGGYQQSSIPDYTSSSLLGYQSPITPDASPNYRRTYENATSVPWENAINLVPCAGYQQSSIPDYTSSSLLEYRNPMTLDASPYNSQTHGNSTSIPSENTITSVSCAGYEQSSIPVYTSSSLLELSIPMTPDASPHYRQTYGNDVTSIHSENTITPVPCAGYRQSSIPDYTTSSLLGFRSPMTPDASPNYRQTYGNATSVPSENAITLVPCAGYQQSSIPDYTSSSLLEYRSPMILDASPYTSQTHGNSTSIPSENAITPVSCAGYEQSSIPGYTSSSLLELWSPMTPDASPHYRQTYGNATSVPSENAISLVPCAGYQQSSIPDYTTSSLLGFRSPMTPDASPQYRQTYGNGQAVIVKDTTDVTCLVDLHVDRPRIAMVGESTKLSPVTSDACNQQLISQISTHEKSGSKISLYGNNTSSRNFNNGSIALSPGGSAALENCRQSVCNPTIINIPVRQSKFDDWSDKTYPSGVYNHDTPIPFTGFQQSPSGSDNASPSSLGLYSSMSPVSSLNNFQTPGNGYLWEGNGTSKIFACH